MARKPDPLRRIRRRAPLWLLHLVGVACLGVAAIAPAIASAAGQPGLQPGVHVDPGSPVAKEYAIPLEQARGASPPETGGASVGGNAGSSIGLFGSGIIPAEPKHDSPEARTRGGSRRVSTRSGTHRVATPVAPPRAVSALAAHAGGTGLGIDWMLAAGILVLFLGGLGGIIFARVERAGASLS